MLLVNNQDISQAVYSISYSDTLNNGPSALECALPPAQAAGFKNGDTVAFVHNGVPVFYGFLFRIDCSVDETRCTAYDQLRYLKSELPLLRQTETLTDFVSRVLAQAGDRIRIGAVAGTDVKLAQKLFDNTSYLDMLYQSMAETTELTNMRFCFRDEFGAVALRGLDTLYSGIVIGDDSLAVDFKHSLAIGDNACNYVKVARDSGQEGLRSAVVAQNSALIARWGRLSAFRQMTQGNDAQLQSLANSLLKERSREEETLALDCIGDLRIRAGSSFRLSISQLGTDFTALIKSATHSFFGQAHTMKLEVERYPA